MPVQCGCGVSADRATVLCQRGVHHCPDIAHICPPDAPCCDFCGTLMSTCQPNSHVCEDLPHTCPARTRPTPFLLRARWFPILWARTATPYRVEISVAFSAN